MTRRFDAVIFDFDYTLADSSQGVSECIRYALGQLGLPPVSHARSCQTIGLSLPETFYKLTGHRDPAQSEAFARLFLARADQVMAERTVLFASVRDTVRGLKERGLSLAIVSTKYRRRIDTILSREGLAEAFAVIIGGEDVAAHKPAPEGLHVAIGTLHANHPLYVGDSVTDAETARRAGVPFVAVLTGVTPRAAFAGYPVWRFVDSLTALPDTVT